MAAQVEATAAEDGSGCHLLELSHDGLGVIVDGLADPLQPVVAVALSSTCKGLRTPLRMALGELAQRYLRVLALCRRMDLSRTELADLDDLIFDRDSDGQSDLTESDLATLGMLLPKWLPRLRRLGLEGYEFGDVGLRAICAGLGPGAAPSLNHLNLAGNKFGPVGAEALAAALRRGAMPKLEELYISSNPISNQGATALALPLRTRPLLKELLLHGCAIGDEGVASLVADLGKDDFKKLEVLYLYRNEMTDAGCATLIAALKSGAMPNLEAGELAAEDNDAASDEAVRAVDEALDARWKAREGSAEA